MGEESNDGKGPCPEDNRDIVGLITQDGQRFAVGRCAAEMSSIVTTALEDCCDKGDITLPNVEGRVLDKMLQFCEHHSSSEDGADDLQNWDNAFFGDLDDTMLLEIIKAADYLDIPLLLDKACQACADLIKGKTPGELRARFNITNDFTPEEEAEVRRTNAWAFD